MNRSGMFLCLALFALPVHAQLALPYLDATDTRFGTMTIAPADLDGIKGQQPLWNDTPVDGIADRFVAIQQVFPAPDGAPADWVLISLANGGNGCPSDWVIVQVTVTDATPSPRFGTCSDAILDIRSEGGTLALDIASFDPAIAHVTFTYDGRAITETTVPRSNDGASVAGADADVTRWIGGHPALPFDDASERLRFGQIMTDDQVFALVARVTVADVVIEMDGFVIGQGFDPNSGGDIAGMWGIRIADGAPFAIFRDTGAAPQLFGLPASDLPDAAAAYLVGEQG